MKKNVLGFALLAMSFVAFNSFAQSTTNTCNTTCAAKAQCDKVKCDKQTKCKGYAKADLFAGLDLTDAQKAKLEQLKADRKAACEKVKAERKAQREAMKKDGKKQQLTKEQKQAMRQECQAKCKAGFRKYLQDVKSIIGSEKYTQFLENMAVENHGHHGKGMKMHGKDFKKGMKGPKNGKAFKGCKDFKGNKDRKCPKGGKR